MKAIILAGGRATRLPKSAKNIPKALVMVGDNTILGHQINALRKHGFFDIRLALGYKSDHIIRYVGRRESHIGHIEYVAEPKPFGTGGAIKFASRGLSEPFMVLNGDILSDINFFGFYKKFKKTREKNMMTVFHSSDARSYGIIKKAGGKISEFLEKPLDNAPAPDKATAGRQRKPERFSGYINAGFYILSPEIFGKMKRSSFSIEKDVFPALAKKGELAFYTHRGFWTDAGTEDRLREVRARYKTK